MLELGKINPNQCNSQLHHYHYLAELSSLPNEAFYNLEKRPTREKRNESGPKRRFLALNERIRKRTSRCRRRDTGMKQT